MREEEGRRVDLRVYPGVAGRHHHPKAAVSARPHCATAIASLIRRLPSDALARELPESPGVLKSFARASIPNLLQLDRGQEALFWTGSSMARVQALVTEMQRCGVVVGMFRL